VTSAVLSVSYGVQENKVYEGKLDIIGLTTPLLFLSDLLYFGGKQGKEMSFFDVQIVVILNCCEFQFISVFFRTKLNYCYKFQYKIIFFFFLVLE